MNEYLAYICHASDNINFIWLNSPKDDPKDETLNPIQIF